MTFPTTEEHVLQRESILIVFLDPDGDDQMQASSPSTHGDDSDSMFPIGDESLNAPPTLQDDITGDLSPPHSQDLPQVDGDEAMDLSGDHIGAMGTDSQGRGLQIDPAQGLEQSSAPGASWNNPKAREEFQRAWNSVVDKKFNLSGQLRSLC